MPYWAHPQNQTLTETTRRCFFFHARITPGFSRFLRFCAEKIGTRVRFFLNGLGIPIPCNYNLLLLNRQKVVSLTEVCSQHYSNLKLMSSSLMDLKGGQFAPPEAQIRLCRRSFRRPFGGWSICSADD